MNALSEDFWGTIDAKAAAEGGLFVRETHWGFIARQDLDVFDRVMEAALKVVGLGLVPVGAGLMFVHGSQGVFGLIFADVGLPIAFILIGLALFLHASRGFRKEIQVDALNREVRLGVANAGGSFRCRRSFQARDIDSAFLLRSRQTGRPSVLNLRLRKTPRPIVLLEAPEKALQPIFERTAEALKKRPARRAKPNKSTRRRSLMSIPLWKKRAQTFDPK